MPMTAELSQFRADLSASGSGGMPLEPLAQPDVARIGMIPRMPAAESVEPEIGHAFGYIDEPVGRFMKMIRQQSPTCN
jgi:hypothetical protein